MSSKLKIKVTFAINELSILPLKYSGSGDTAPLA
jgi:hypothetical protein